MAGRNYKYPSPYKSRPLLTAEADRVLRIMRRGWRLTTTRGRVAVWLESPHNEWRSPIKRRTLDLLLDGCYVRPEGHNTYVLWSTAHPEIRRAFSKRHRRQ